jgi:hypothetical protein
LIQDNEIVEKLHSMLPEGFKLTRIEDRSAYVHLRLEDGHARKVDIIKPFEEKQNITVISDVITSKSFLQLINELTHRLSTM